MNTVHYQVEDNVILVSLDGEVTLEVIERHRDDILENISASNLPVLVDMEKVTFMDSGAIGFLVSILKEINKSKRIMAVSGADGQPRIVLRMVGIDEHVRIHQDKAEALKFIKERSD